MNHLHLFYCLKHAFKSTSLTSYRKLTLMQTYVRPHLVKVSQNMPQIENIENIRIFTTHACMSGLSIP